MILDTELYRLVALRSALRLEMLGMKNSRRSAYAIIKEEFGFKGNKQKVYNQIDAYIKKQRSINDSNNSNEDR